MQIKKILLTAILCANVIFTYAQNLSSTLSGTVKTNTGEVLPGATIKISKTAYGSISDANGIFRIANITPGNYIIVISAIGFSTQKREITLTAGNETKLSFSITEHSAQMETVNVVGRTKAQEVNRQAFNVTAIDAAKLYNTTLDISGALDRVAGLGYVKPAGLDQVLMYLLMVFQEIIFDILSMASQWITLAHPSRSTTFQLIWPNEWKFIRVWCPCGWVLMLWVVRLIL